MKKLVALLLTLLLVPVMIPAMAEGPTLRIVWTPTPLPMARGRH